MDEIARLRGGELMALADAFVEANRAEFLDLTVDDVLSPDDPDLPILRAIERIAEQAWRSGAITALDFATRNEDGITLSLDLDVHPNPYAPTLPEETGPATLDAVKHRANIDLADHDDDLNVIVIAVNDVVSGLPVAQDQDGTEDHPWRPRVVLGANMLGARLFGRRNSTNGIEGFSVDAALYVRRNDPDIAMLLQLGDYAKPSVG